MANKSKKSNIGEVSIVPAGGDCHYELGYESGLDFERLRQLQRNDPKVRGRKGVKKC